MIYLKFFFTPILLVLSLTSVWAAPSVVVLDSGEQLIGEISSESTDTMLILESAVLGELKLARQHVLSVKPQVAGGHSKTLERPQPKAVAKAVAVKPAVVKAQAKPLAQAASAETSAKLAGKPAERQVAAERKSIDDEISDIQERKVLETLMDFKAPETWSGNMRLGLNLSRGDSRWAQSYATGKLEIKPKQSLNFYRFSGSYTYRQTERANGVEYKSTDKYDVEFIYRRTFWEDWFLQNALGYRADQIKGIDREAQESIGIGYRFKPSDKFDVLFGGGGGFEEFEANYEDTHSGFNSLVNVFQEATWSPLKRTSFVQKFNYYWTPGNSEQFNYVVSAAIRVRLTDLLGFEFSYNKSFDNDVGNGNAQDDTQWRNALVVYF